ncbi:hypothetical protein BLNAU_22900 [Blattamonas nauphoetae]|uniref:Uncharacterized protein n=1 Tax=Blattamonas nauphoetae TaxID=2049346 RepID=A0ABQ9WRP7_9EUKA|nr:hypothetical protein BLNAU_22900 [Blattamonas nauphoetae]
MKEETDSLKTSNDVLSNGSLDSPSTIVVNNEPFLHFDPNSDLSFKDQSTIYNSLVSLVKESYHFDNALQERAAQFLKGLEPMWGDEDDTAKLVRDLVPSSDGSPSGFVESILTLLSSPHSTVVAAALSFLRKTTSHSPMKIRLHLVESDLITKLLTTVRPHTLQISGNEEIFDELLGIIDRFVDLASTSSLSERGITVAVEAFDHREMIFQKVVIPSSQFVTFLISNRHILNGDLLESFMFLLAKFIKIGPFHRTTLEFILASPIVMAFSNCLSFVEDESYLWSILMDINRSLYEWKREGPEVSQSGKLMLQALFSEGFADTLEQMLKHDKSDGNGEWVVNECHSISKLLGSNVELTENDDDEDSEDDDEATSLE